jgi:hypothetical protein
MNGAQAETPIPDWRIVYGHFNISRSMIAVTRTPITITNKASVMAQSSSFTIRLDLALQESQCAPGHFCRVPLPVRVPRPALPKVSEKGI